jgi:hypothetical protein
MAKWILLILALGVPVVLSALGKDKRGTLLGMPYDFEVPTMDRLRRSVWDPDDRRVLTPKVYGWGNSMNVHALARRLGLV